MEQKPIFVYGISRSGTTLMCTLMDAHRDVAMTYELFPDLLVTDEVLDLKKLAADFLSHADINTIRKHHPEMFPTQAMQTFILRVARGGLSHHDFANNLLALVAEGKDFTTVAGRMRFVEMFGIEKMKRAGKSRWGMKTGARFADYLSVWPNAIFLNMIRDGRDVFASQLNNGSFNPDPERLGRAWTNAMLQSEAFINSASSPAMLVRYETLAAEPEPVLRQACALADLPFDEAMLRHTDQDLTIFKVRHLSGKRLAQSVDASMIGRWRNDLNPDQLAKFMGIAGDAIRHFGYPEA